MSNLSSKGCQRARQMSHPEHVRFNVFWKATILWFLKTRPLTFILNLCTMRHVSHVYALFLMSKCDPKTIENFITTNLYASLSFCGCHQVTSDPMDQT